MKITFEFFCGSGSIITKDTLDTVRVGVVKAEAVLCVAELCCIIGLLVLPPTDITNECGIVADNALASNFGEVSVFLVLDPGAIEFESFRVANRSVSDNVGSC